MKIRVGTKYEGMSSGRLEDGDYELQIVDVQSTKGRVNMTFKTSTGKEVYKTFFLLDRDGKTVNEKGMRELSDYVTTAMQVNEEEVEVDVKNALGFYLLCYVKNAQYTKKETGEVKKVYNVYSPRRCDGFSDGTESLYDTSAVNEEEYEDDPAAEADADDDLPFNTNIGNDDTEDGGDILSRLGV